MPRHDSRRSNQLRPLKIRRRYTRSAAGSVLIQAGKTVVLCTASVEANVPGWLAGSGKGWITAEYNMLPGSTSPRKARRTDGRSTEIQRLIGRGLRAVADLQALGEQMIAIDCDVLDADGGTRTASISGGFVALYQAVLLLQKNYNIQKPIIKEFIAAISAGIIENQPNLDLDYNEDFLAQVDANFIICESGKIAEIQVTGEEYFFSDEQFQSIFNLAKKGISEIIQKQKEVFSS